MTFPRSDELIIITPQEQKGIHNLHHSNFPDLLTKYLPPTLTDPMTAFIKLDDSPTFQKQVLNYVQCVLIILLLNFSLL